MDWYRRQDKRDALNNAEKNGEVADSMDVRLNLLRKLNTGEMTLAEVQSELKKIKRNAGKNGKITRNQAWRRG